MRLGKKLLELQEIRFIIIGVLNTVIGTTVMFVAYNIGGLGYWISSSLNYIAGSIFSYYANKYFTFKATEKSKREIIRFILNITVCYFVAYGLAKPLISTILGKFNFGIEIIDQISMVMGMCLFVIINF